MSYWSLPFGRAIPVAFGLPHPAPRKLQFAWQTFVFYICTTSGHLLTSITCLSSVCQISGLIDYVCALHYINAMFLIFEKDIILKLVASPHIQECQRFRNIKFTVLNQITTPAHQKGLSYLCIKLWELNYFEFKIQLLLF